MRFREAFRQARLRRVGRRRELLRMLGAQLAVDGADRLQRLLRRVDVPEAGGAGAGAVVTAWSSGLSGGDTVAAGVAALGGDASGGLAGAARAAGRGLGAGVAGGGLLRWRQRRHQC
jgi:hypothetical protein